MKFNQFQQLVYKSRNHWKKYKYRNFKIHLLRKRDFNGKEYYALVMTMTKSSRKKKNKLVTGDLFKRAKDD